MKKINQIILLVALPVLVGVTAGCGNKATTRDVEPAETAPSAQTTPAENPAAATGTKGKILETLDSGGYTYLRLDVDGQEIWAAGPVTPGLEPGEQVSLLGAMEMRDFTAKSLDRTFDRILFLGNIDTGASTGGMGHAKQPISGAQTKVEKTKVEGVQPVAGGYTIADIYSRAAELTGKEVTLRARVVKVTPNVMGTNWLHVQDGTGSEETSDLAVTTAAELAAGDLVLIKGPLSVDKDFGAGYLYHVIVEGATVTK